MKRISVQLPSDLLELLKRRAKLKKISVSQHAMELINKGLSQKAAAEEKSFDLSTTSRIDRYLLKNGIEALLLLRCLLPEKDRFYIAQATETSKEVVKQLLDHKNLTDKE